MNRSTTLLPWSFISAAKSKQPFGCSVIKRAQRTRSVTKESRRANLNWIKKLSVYIHLNTLASRKIRIAWAMNHLLTWGSLAVLCTNTVHYSSKNQVWSSYIEVNSIPHMKKINHCQEYVQFMILNRSFYIYEN